MSSDKVCNILLLSAVAALVAFVLCKKDTSTNKYPTSMRDLKDNKHKGNKHKIHNSTHVEPLPIACVGTLGGDIMMCPSSGICPLNGSRCQPSPPSKPCCTDWYYPESTMDQLYLQHHGHTFLRM